MKYKPLNNMTSAELIAMIREAEQFEREHQRIRAALIRNGDVQFLTDLETKLFSRE